MIDGHTKSNPPTKKLLQLETDVPELLVEMGYGKSRSVHAQAVVDLSLSLDSYFDSIDFKAFVCCWSSPSGNQKFNEQTGRKIDLLTTDVKMGCHTESTSILAVIIPNVLSLLQLMMVKV
jgi:hypothetical protein